MMINIVWFKRDLRLTDHMPLKTAIDSGRKTLLLFIIEPILVASEHYSNRHWKFMMECLKDMQDLIAPHETEICILEGEIIELFSALQREYGTFELYSHLEIGIDITYKRDIEVAKWMKNQGFQWREFHQNAITRGRKNRNNWNKEWELFMNEPLQNVDLSLLKSVTLSSHLKTSFKQTLVIQKESEAMQIGGRIRAEKLLKSFLNKRYLNYSRSISKPTESRSYCSRLSPYIAWGALSIREITQQTAQRMRELPKNRSLQNYMSRLHWHCHFIQKFESSPEIEFINQNPAFNVIRNKLNTKHLEAWCSGKTGVPLIDACMRCVNETGYINFRMRAMVVSFWTHNLQQPWQPAADHLSKQFLDFEPGIHFPQIQMQAGTVGYHTLRIYNPIKQAEDHDPDAVFIKKWVPELANLPAVFAREPWQMTPIESLMDNFHLGEDYPFPICDIEESARLAKDEIYRIKKSTEARMFARQISKVHVNK
jgi:deoxyribodipyrimidine photo-lyase